MRIQLFFLLCLAAKGWSLSCIVCDSGTFAGNYIQKSIGTKFPGLQNQATCMNANLDQTDPTFVKDCNTVVEAPNNVLPMYCARVDYSNSTTAMEVIRTCAPVGTTGTICGINNGVETCGFVTACSTNNCNNKAYTGVNPYTGTNTGSSSGSGVVNGTCNCNGNGNGGTSIVAHVLTTVVGLFITLRLYH